MNDSCNDFQTPEKSNNRLKIRNAEKKKSKSISNYNYLYTDEQHISGTVDTNLIKSMDSMSSCLKCPICWRIFKPGDDLHRSSHLKSCGTKHGFGAKQLMDILNLEKRQTNERMAIGLPMVTRKPSINKTANHKSSKLMNDPELDLALALSASIAPVTNPIAADDDDSLISAPLTFMNQIGKKQNLDTKEDKRFKSSVKFDLKIRSQNERNKIISKRVDRILNQPENSYSSSIIDSTNCFSDPKSHVLCQLLDIRKTNWSKAADYNTPEKKNLEKKNAISDYIADGETDLADDWLTVFNARSTCDSTDIIIYTCDEQPVFCHKLVLRARCKPALLREIISERSVVSDHIVVKNYIMWNTVSRDAVEAFLMFVYCGRFSVDCSKTRDEVVNLLNRFCISLSWQKFISLSSTDTIKDGPSVFTQNLEGLIDVLDEPDNIEQCSSPTSSVCIVEERKKDFTADVTHDLSGSSHLITDWTLIKKRNSLNMEAMSPDMFEHCDELLVTPQERRISDNNKRSMDTFYDFSSPFEISNQSSAKSRRLSTIDVSFSKKTDVKLVSFSSFISPNVESQFAPSNEALLPGESVTPMSSPPSLNLLNETMLCHVVESPESFCLRNKKALCKLDGDRVFEVLKSLNEFQLDVGVLLRTGICDDVRKFLSTPGEVGQLANAIVDKWSLMLVQSPAVQITPVSSYVYDQVTPLPNYNTMMTPVLRQALGRYGIKALPRRKAVRLLTHIYNEMHPLVEVDHSDTTDSSSNTNKEDDENYEFLPYLTQADDDIDPDPDETEKQLVQFIRQDSSLYEKVLLYEPLWLEDLVASFRASSGLRCSLACASNVLDAQCITFRTRSNRKRTQSKREFKRKRKTCT